MNQKERKKLVCSVPGCNWSDTKKQRLIEHESKPHDDLTGKILKEKKESKKDLKSKSDRDRDYVMKKKEKQRIKDEEYELAIGKK